MPARKKSGGQVYVARDSGQAEIKGVPYFFHKGITRVRDGHPLTKLDGFDNIFEPVDGHVHFDTEQATSAPDETRDVNLAGEGDDLEEHTIVELREFAKDRGVEGYSTMNKADLVKALEE